MKLIVRIVLILAMSVACLQAHAVTVKGAPSCGDWVKDRKAGGWSSTANLGWLVGFLSGLSVASRNEALKDTNVESLSLWMDNYCRSNPLKDVDDGGMDLFIELKAMKKR